MPSSLLGVLSIIFRTLEDSAGIYFLNGSCRNPFYGNKHKTVVRLNTGAAREAANHMMHRIFSEALLIFSTGATLVEKLPGGL
jgi:hypothetical protein